MHTSASIDHARKVLDQALSSFAQLLRKTTGLGSDATTAGVMDGASDVAVLPLRLKAMRLAALCYRRRGAFEKAIQLCSSADAIISKWSEDEKSKPTADQVAQAALFAMERSRVYFSLAVESAFTDKSSLESLVKATEAFPSFLPPKAAKSNPQSEQLESKWVLLAAAVPPWNAGHIDRVCRSTVLALAVCHVMGLLALGAFAKAEHAIEQVESVLGMQKELAVMKALLAVGIGRSTTKQKQVKSSSSTVEVTSWVSAPLLAVLEALLDLLTASATCDRESSIQHCNRLVEAVEDRMRALTDVSRTQAGSTQINSEVRCLVGVKLVAYSELVVMDLSKLSVCAAVSKLLPLTQYVTLFHRHTAHFRPYIHLLIGVLAACLQRPEEALEHAERVLDSALPSSTADVSAILTCESALAGLLLKAQVGFIFANQVRFQQVFEATVDTLQSAINPSSLFLDSAPEISQRHKIALGTLFAAHHLHGRDYNSASGLLKQTVDASKEFFGVSAPPTAMAMRLLGTAYDQAGQEEKAEVSVTAASQLAAKCGDVVALAGCLTWMVAHPGSSAPSTHHSQLISLSKQYAAELDTGNGSSVKDVDEILAFLPGRSQAYDEWVAKTNGARRRGGQGTVNGSAGKKRTREE